LWHLKKLSDIYRKIATFGYMEVKRYAVLTYYLHTGYDNTYRGHTKTAIWILSKKKVCNYKNPLIGIYEQYCSRCKAMVPGVG